MFGPSDTEEKKRRKFGRALRNAFGLAGVGLGLVLLKPIWNGFDSSENPGFAAAQEAGFVLLAHGVLVLALALLRREWVVPVNALLLYLIVPAALLFIVMDKS